jgi:hypothetical protein
LSIYVLTPPSFVFFVSPFPLLSISQTAYDEAFASQLDDLLRAVLFGLFGSFNQPADEVAVIRLLEFLMSHQLEAQESRPDNFLRKSSLFSKYVGGRVLEILVK